ncbi:hypothetical protein XSR1_320043 [Xenorhabdus szentirmaii DSM 16338]|uniref:Transposase n=1 Tax=Xenorhabdus szentirmaii DSM 16338 TaxID=1427518 RepID=W1J0H2_9GAMM|nr:hypothetical protein XSR1_320043 [Xenorhabdus szentirmaii DSM 16338]
MIAGHFFTHRIEHENLTLLDRIKRLNRKTLGYSKSPEMHDKIIGTFIERVYYISKENIIFSASNALNTRPGLS